MNIVHLVENLNRGGLERVVIDLVRAQQAAGHHCAVVCLFDKGSLADELERTGIPVAVCNKRHGLDLRALLKLRGFLRQHRAEVLHTHNQVPHYYAIPAAFGLDIQRIICTRHGMGDEDVRSRRESLFRFTLSRTAAVVTVCESARRELLTTHALDARKVVAVPNGIVVSQFQSSQATARAALAPELGFASGTRLFGSVGRLTPAKDQANLIRAFSLLHQRHPDTGLVLIGDGSLRDELVALAAAEGVSEAVRFLGDRGDVAHLLQGLSVFVLSSVTEGYSIALLEACAAALPIVATDVGGNAEIVRDGVNGRIVAPRAPELLASAMAELLHDEARATRMGAEGRAWVLANASIPVMAQRYMQIYQGLLPS